MYKTNLERLAEEHAAEFIDDDVAKHVISTLTLGNQYEGINRSLRELFIEAFKMGYDMSKIKQTSYCETNKTI